MAGPTRRVALTSAALTLAGAVGAGCWFGVPASSAHAGAAAHPAASASVPSPGAASPSAPSTAAPASTPTPSTSATVTSVTATHSPSEAVGALFADGSTEHECTGSVISSPAGDLVLTAAHCVTGSGAGMTFVPGYSKGAAPAGTWTVVAAYAPSSWSTSQDPSDDVAVLKVADRTTSGGTVTLQETVGAEQLGSTPTAGETVTSYGYVAGSGDSALTCTTAVAEVSTQLGSEAMLPCAGFAGGTSGSPWLVTNGGSASVVGIVGGLNQGGCEDDQSYSPTDLGTDVQQLVARAAAASAGDTLPVAGSSGC